VINGGGFAQPPKAITIAILVNGSFVTRLKLLHGIREVRLAAPGECVVFVGGA
jgi:hypothetical protein